MTLLEQGEHPLLSQQELAAPLLLPVKSAVPLESETKINLFRGIYDPFKDISLISIDSFQGPGLVVVGDSSFVDNTGCVGMVTHYDEVTPRDARLYLVAVHEKIAKNPRLLEAIIKRANVLFLYGGQDLSPETTGVGTVGDDHKAFHGYDPVRDQVDIQLARSGLTHDHIFPFFICRGSEVGIYTLTGIPPNNVDSHHFMEGGQKKFTYHPVKNVLNEFLPQEHRIYPPIPDIRKVNSFHHQGYTFGRLREALPLLAKLGWFPLFVDDTEGFAEDQRVVESFVRLKLIGNPANKQYQVTGIMEQFHAERQDDEDGGKLKKWSLDALEMHKARKNRFSFIQ